MERIDGYLCIDDCEKVLADKDKHQYWVIINNEEYYFKPATLPYHELIAYYAAEILGIEACYCDLAVLNGEKGIISKSLRNKKDKLVLGDVFLDDYLLNSMNNIKKMGLSKGMADLIEIDYFEGGYSYSEQVNNLEIIWQALEYRYGNKVNIKEIMNQFVLMYLFTIIFHDVDKHPGNWMLIENKEGVNLAPLFDNERIFEDYCCGVNLSTSFNDSGDDICSSLKEFLKISSSEYFDFFVIKYDEIISNFDRILELVERQIGAEIPFIDRGRIVLGFSKNRLMIEKALDSFSKKRCLKN